MPRCSVCAKKVPLYMSPCECGKVVCMAHVQLERHDCSEIAVIREKQREALGKRLLDEKQTTDRGLRS